MEEKICPMRPPSTPQAVEEDDALPNPSTPIFNGKLKNATTTTPSPQYGPDPTVIILAPLFDNELRSPLQPSAAIGFALPYRNHPPLPFKSPPGTQITTANQTLWDRDSAWLDAEYQNETWSCVYPQHRVYMPMLDQTPSKPSQLFTEKSIARYLTEIQLDLCRQLRVFEGPSPCRQRFKRVQLPEELVRPSINEITLLQRRQERQDRKTNEFLHRRAEEQARREAAQQQIFNDFISVPPDAAIEWQ